MNLQLLSIVLSPLGILIGYLLAFLQQKWTQKQHRINIFLEKRFTAYSEGLEFIYEAEQNQTEPKKLDRILKKWRKWFPLNCVYFSPSLKSSLLKQITLVTVISVDLHNRDVDRERWNEFKHSLRKTKNELMSLKDVGWLPKDLK